MLFDSIESSNPPAFYDRLVNHDPDIDGYHQSHGDHHREAQLEPSHQVSIEVCEAEVVIDLDQPKEVVDVVDDIISHQDEPSCPIEVNQVEHTR